MENKKIETSNKELVKQLIGKDWTPPSNHKIIIYEFYVIDKETKNLVYKGFNKDDFNFKQKTFNSNNHWFIELNNGKVINSNPAFEQKYSQLISKINADKYIINDPFIIDMLISAIKDQ